MFRTILLELFSLFRPFKKTVNIRWTTISAHTRTKQNGGLLLRNKAARQLSTCFNRWLHSAAVTDWTIEPLNQKSQIAQEYGLLPTDA